MSSGADGAATDESGLAGYHTRYLFVTRVNSHCLSIVPLASSHKILFIASLRSFRSSAVAHKQIFIALTSLDSHSPSIAPFQSASPILQSCRFLNQSIATLDPYVTFSRDSIARLAFV